jgi:NAD(P)-dependent dehydrogenase (short-subunit alcohol dehydrogenase family)
MTNPQRPPPFPSANTPRTWLITSAASPIGLTLSRALLAHGDKLILGVKTADRDIREGTARAQDLAQFIEEARTHGWSEKFKIVELDARCEPPVFCFLLNQNKKFSGFSKVWFAD